MNAMILSASQESGGGGRKNEDEIKDHYRLFMLQILLKQSWLKTGGWEPGGEEGGSLQDKIWRVSSCSKLTAEMLIS